MRLSSFLLVVLYVILFTACKQQHPEFKNREVLTQELMPLQGITNPLFMDVKNPFLIIQNRSRTDSLFHIYDLNDYKLKSVFGVSGRGPGEFLLPMISKTYLPNLVIIDANNDFKTYYFDINDNGEPILVNSRQPEFINMLGSVGFINDTLMVVDDYIFSPNLHILSFNDQLPRKSWQYGNPNIFNRFIDPDYGRVFANDKRIVFCYRFKKQIDFMDTDLNLMKRVSFDYPSVKSITEQNQSDVRIAYTSGYLGKRYFYALFQGASMKESDDPSFKETALEVFDLDGNPVIRYNFDGIAPTSFVIDEDNFTLYGLRNDGEPLDNLLVYKLKEIK